MYVTRTHIFGVDAYVCMSQEHIYLVWMLDVVTCVLWM